MFSYLLRRILYAVPILIGVMLMLAVSIALYLVFVRDSTLDTFAAFGAVALMSVPPMVYIIFGQALIALVFNYFPAFGFDRAGLSTLKFLTLPVALMAVMGL